LKLHDLILADCVLISKCPWQCKGMAMKLILSIFISSLALAQSPGAGNTATSTNLPAQKIGPNDLISVAVYGSPEFSRTLRVGADGLIRMPMLKARVRAQGLYPADVESAVAAALKVEELVVDPFVTVTIAEYHSRPINVAGAVKSPLTFQASGPVTLLEALTRAGGLTVDAGSEILVTRTAASANKSEALVQRVPVKGLIDAAEPKWNLELNGGEEIRVPEVGKIFVVGNVKRPGAYALPGGDEITVLKALALAEGLSPYASKQAFIYRREANGSKNEIKIELKALLQRKAEDAVLTANDVLYIPDNTGRRMGVAALERALMFGTTAGATALIYGR
jgi:polysaccharide biosynthesis/export protein